MIDNFPPIPTEEEQQICRSISDQILSIVNKEGAEFGHNIADAALSSLFACAAQIISDELLVEDEAVLDEVLDQAKHLLGYNIKNILAIRSEYKMTH